VGTAKRKPRTSERLLAPSRRTGSFETKQRVKSFPHPARIHPVTDLGGKPEPTRCEGNYKGGEKTPHNVKFREVKQREGEKKQTVEAMGKIKKEKEKIRVGWGAKWAFPVRRSWDRVKSGGMTEGKRGGRQTGV